MKAYVTRGPGQMHLVDLPAPVPRPEEVLVKVAYCSVCGSDITAFEGQVYEVPEGMILGHEVSGTVAQTGERVRDLVVGDRVALEPAVPCRRCWYCQHGQYHMCPQTVHLGDSIPGGFAEYLTIHELNAHRLPAGVSLREAAPMEPLGVCLAGLRRARLAVGERVAVFGDGPFGLIFARLAIIMGAAHVCVLGHHDWRLERIRAPQVETVNTHRTPPSQALGGDADAHGGHSIGAGGGSRVDLALVATGSPVVYGDILPAVRAQGRILAFSYPSDAVTLNLALVHMRELEIIGSCRCPHTFETLFDLIEQERLAPEELISSVVPLENLPEAFALARGRDKELFKILIEI